MEERWINDEWSDEEFVKALNKFDIDIVGHFPSENRIKLRGLSSDIDSLIKELNSKYNTH